MEERDTSAEGRDIGYKGGEGNGSGHKYKHAKEEETENGLDQIQQIQPCKIQHRKTQRMERKEKLAQLQTLPVTLCQLLFCLGDVSTLRFRCKSVPLPHATKMFIFFAKR